MSSIYSLAGRVGGYARAAKHDGREMTEKARRTFTESFLDGHQCKVCPPVIVPAGLPPAERGRRAEALRRSHFARVALASARARRATKKAATGAKVTARGAGRAESTTTPTPAA